MKRSLWSLPIAVALTALLGACGSDSDADAVEVDEVVLEEAGTAGESDSNAMAGFTDCSQVEAAVAQYIEGLQADPSNGADEYSVSCGWETPDGAVDFSQIREVSVQIMPARAAVPTQEVLEAGGLEMVSGTGIETSGGIAYTLPVSTAVSAAIVTTVMWPDVEVQIGGGQWGDLPALDAPAATAIARQLLAR